MRKIRTAVDQKKFDLVKLLISNNVRGSALEKITGLSSATLSMIRRSDTIERYKSMCHMMTKSVKDTLVVSVLPSKNTETPIYDTLVAILDEIRTLNAYIAEKGGKGKFRLF